MLAYIIRRILLMIPTIFGIMALSFAVVQFAPGGPIERVIAQLQGRAMSAPPSALPAAADDLSCRIRMAAARIPAAAIAARRGSIRSSSPSLSANSASTSRRWNASR
jgi:ABC-type microcin C transport system permease subunit YejB